jgi:hypothetical protein
LEEKINAPQVPQRDETNLGEILLKQFKGIVDYNPMEEKSVEVLKNNLNRVIEFYERNKTKLNNDEVNYLTGKSNSIRKRIESISQASKNAVEKITQKGDYRRGRPYKHTSFGKGIINSVEKVEDGIYNIIVQFNQPYGLKKLRVKEKEKEKPEVAYASGLAESLRVKIRQLILKLL